MSAVSVRGEWSFDGASVTRDAALDAAVRGVPEKLRVMPGGERFWLPASSPEESGPVTGECIHSMACELNASTHPRPIDGGAGDSPTHAYAERGDVPATGWVHRAVVADVDGAPMLFLECEVLSSVAPLVREGRIAFTSIHAEIPREEGGELDSSGAVLVSLGLTNRPANEGLPPAMVVRGARTFAHVVTRAVALAGVCRMADKEAPPAAKDKPVEEVKKAEPTTAELLTRIEELEAKLSAAMGENEALSAMRDALSAEVTEARAAAPARDAEREAVEAVDTAVREGRFGKRQRDAMLVVARKDLEVFRASMFKLPKLGETTILRSEVKPAESLTVAGQSAEVAALHEAATHRPEAERAAFITRGMARITARKAV